MPSLAANLHKPTKIDEPFRSATTGSSAHLAKSDSLSARVCEAECATCPEANRLFAEGRLRIEMESCISNEDQRP
jgi:hypothetical protein